MQESMRLKYEPASGDADRVHDRVVQARAAAVPRRARIKAHRLLYRSTLGLGVIKKKEEALLAESEAATMLSRSAVGRTRHT